MQTGYVTSFIPLKFALLVFVEYVCPDGHRIRHREEYIYWDSKWMVWQ